MGLSGPTSYFRALSSDRTSQTTEALGTGIGLSLTKKLIEFHQGTLKIESDLGKGTKVTITLPNERIIHS
ncbi:ATP-binding protein [Kiloniella sp.]|uniref:ATP-binding protein n=1 Tax=Kiloniella sp. TaxID=1938587 RepID=UPI003A8E5653